MLERLQIPEEITVRVRQEGMRSSVVEIFRKMGMPDTGARQAADVLMYADIRGIESHGVSNMMQTYLNMFREGLIYVNPHPKIISEVLAVATLDSYRGFGLVIGP